MHGWLWFLAVLNLYFLLIYVLVKKGWLARLNMSLFGPALMIKTQRGRGLLDWFARARALFDRSVAFGTYLTYTIMFLMSLVLVLQLWVIWRIPPEATPSPRLLLGIPGVNPIIPVGFGIVALIFAVVVHELSHGILARVYQLRVKTMGLLFLVIPIGAFVEPDEEELKRAPRKQRVRVFSAGPTTNLFFALFFALIFSPVLMGSAEPVPGAPILAVEAEGPACQAGLLPTWIIDAAGNTTTRAEAEPIPNRATLSRILNATPVGEPLYLWVTNPTIPKNLRGTACVNETSQASGVYPVVPVPCAAQYSEETCWLAGNATRHPDPLSRSVIGISLYATDEVHAVLASPLPSMDAFIAAPLSSMGGLLSYISLPFFALQGQFPLTGSFEAFYVAPFHADTFWALANLTYWLFWINLMLGLTNALPILPLDGGHMFRDLLGGWIERRNPQLPPERRDAIVKRISITVALVLFALVILQFVGPPIIGLFR